MSAPPELPEIVTRAFDVSRRAGYVSFCRNETGRLLAALAATRDGTMAEFGTGCGVGTAWLRSGVRGEETRILTAELDPTLAEAAADLRRSGRHPARGVAERRALHRGRGAGGPRRIGRDRDPPLTSEDLPLRREPERKARSETEASSLAKRSPRQCVG